MKIKFYNKLNFKITFGIVAALAIILSISTYLLNRYHSRQWIDSLKTSTTNLSAIVSSSIQYSMLDNHRELIKVIVKKVGQEQSLRDIMIFDKKGTVKFASDPVMVGMTIPQSETTCLICHRLSPENRSTTIIYTNPMGEKVFRNVNPLFNNQECHRCHDPAEKINGVLIMDFSMAQINKALKADVKRVLVWTVVVIGIMSAVLWLLLNRTVIHRLSDFLKHTDRVGRGDLDAIVKEIGSDEIAILAHDFNRMTEDLKEYIKIKEVRVQKEQLEKLVDSIDEGVLVVDREDVVVAANQAAAQLLGKTSQELIGKACCPLFDRDDEEHLYCLSRETFLTGSLKKVIRSFRDSKGRERELEFYASPIKDSLGNVEQVVEVIRDITERKKLEAELLHSERLASLGLMASGISHEIKNPLASITTCIEGLQRMLKTSHSPLNNKEMNKLNKYLALSRKEAERCKIITDKLLYLSRKSIPSTQMADINKCLEETVSLLDFESRRHGIKVEMKLNHSIPPMYADESDFREIFFNIILNAVQAMQEKGGRLTVGTALRDEYVEVSISDTGSGINKEDLDKVFEPFFTRKPPGKGTGLGLYICRNLLEQMGGEISVSSSQGNGAEFVVRLPLVTQPAGTEEKAL